MIRMSLVRAQEEREQRRREEEYKIDELKRYYGKVRETEAGFKSIENVHARRRIREMRERESEYLSSLRARTLLTPFVLKTKTGPPRPAAARRVAACASALAITQWMATAFAAPPRKWRACAS